MTSTYFIAFWNLENLFDVEDSPRRSEKLQRALGESIEGWTQDLLNKKVAQLASIITQMNDGNGPDMLGVCEVENDHVLNLLIDALAPLGRNYKVQHHDMSDRRGIDVGFIYDEDLFTFSQMFNHVVMRRTATRDILQVNFKTKQDRLFVVVGNHWPARSAGQLESEPYRIIAGETLAYFHSRILEVHGSDTPVLAMGDFNDQPFDRSLTNYALSIRNETRIKNARNPYFLNLMWPFLQNDIATYYFGSIANVLDQFLANKNMLISTAPIRILPDSVEVVRFPEMTDTGDYPKPIRFGGMGKDVDEDGFSDHFPISVLVEEDD